MCPIGDKLVPGAVFYRFYIDCLQDNDVPVVETWRYIGYIERKISSSSCNKPFWFYRFELVGAGKDCVETLDFPSRDQLSDMLSFSEFAALVAEQ